MRARLDAQRAVGVRRLDAEGGRLEPGLFRVRRVVHLGGVAVPLRPAQVHPLQHLGEVRGVDATGAGPDRHQRLAFVVLAGQQGANLERLDQLGQRADLLLRLGQRVRVVLLAAHLHQHAEVVDPAAQFRDPLQVGLQAGQPGRHLLRVRLVVPQVGRGHLFAEVGDLSAHALQIEHFLDRGQGCVELLQVSVEIRSSHNQAAYPLRAPRREFGASAVPPVAKHNSCPLGQRLRPGPWGSGRGAGPRRPC